MKSMAMLMTILMITIIFVGCIADDEFSEELVGTTWITIEEDGFGGLDDLSISVISFKEDGVLEESYLPNNEDECDESLGLVPSEKNPGLCMMVMNIFGSESSSEDSMTWKVTLDGALSISMSMSITGDEYDEEFCDSMIEYRYETENYDQATIVSWEGTDFFGGGTCDISLRLWQKSIVGDGTLVLHPFHRVKEASSQLTELPCTLGIPWTGQNLEDMTWLVHEELLSLCPEPVNSETLVWNCRVEVRLDPTPNGVAQGRYRSYAQLHSGYPEWCGSPIPLGIADAWNQSVDPGLDYLDSSESLLPPAHRVYGWEDEGGYRRGRNATHFVGDWFGQDECSNMTIYDIFEFIDLPEDKEGEVGEWDEKLSKCATPVPCEREVDSEFIYEACWPSPYVRYHWDGVGFLYLGHVAA